MADNPVFEHDDCEVEPVSPIPDWNMLIDPTVPDPPESIPDCFNTTPTPLPPPIPALPDIEDLCPDIEVGTATVMYDNIPEPVVIFEFVQSTGCAFTVNLDITLPTAVLDCPSITIGGGSSGGTVTIDENASDAALNFTVTKHPTLCTFDFDFDLVLPNFCPIITTTGSSISINSLISVPTLSFNVVRNSSGPNCDFNLDLDIQIPDFCPTLSVGSATISINSGITTPTVDFSIDKNPSACDFVFDLDIQLPDFCPTFDASGSNINLDENIISPEISIDFDREAGGGGGEYSCQFNVTASISIPAKRVDVVTDIACSNNSLAIQRKQILVLRDLGQYAPFAVPQCCRGNPNTETSTTTGTEADCPPCDSELLGNLRYELESLEGCPCLNGLSGPLPVIGPNFWGTQTLACEKNLQIQMTCDEEGNFVMNFVCYPTTPPAPVYEPYIMCLDPFEVIFEITIVAGTFGCCEGVVRVHVF